MYLKRLELQGFKSFADKTILEFKPGITSVIGPNGSGKSNISDAIRWVLGEQSMKSLRGAKSEDIIFAGTQERKSLGFAEVSIVIDNSDAKLPIEYAEVTVTRKIYRNGETGYFINKTPCRLKDILELFMDTGIGKDGYSIIGQGKIDEILSNKSEDRRAIFEEAAGVLKYKRRKEEALRKLDKTNQNLNRVNDIINDLMLKKRMNRLLQGDVGSGKTIVAFISMYANYLSGYQSALMAPTEILATQHYEEAKRLFSDYDINVALLTSSTSSKDKKAIYKGLEDGSISIVIGTQSLIQENVKYKSLGLVITDEQHRFGVNQRDTFKSKGISPDVLTMSATPIPRTYALTIYGDTDVSSIKSKPSGRKEVITLFKKEKDILDVLEMMKKELDIGHQIYVVAPMIDTEDDSEKESVYDLQDKMNKAFGKISKIGIIHGKLDSKDKDKVMKDFEKNKINILISTTVIEEGVNVPNASMIVIFNANMFGLSTLHQLRGRVGRGDIQSYCVLVAKESEERLRFLENTSDGFEISEYDFQTRGEGDLFGTRQSGDLGFKMANIKKDFKMLLKAKSDADEFINMLLTFTSNPEFEPMLEELKKVDNLE